MEDGPPFFTAGFTCPQLIWIQLSFFGFHLQDYHFLRSDFPFGSVNLCLTFAVLNPDGVSTFGLASSAFARHYSRNLFDFFSSAYLDVSVRQVPLLTLCIHVSIPDSSSGGFPHSEIHGSTLIYSYPWLIAVSHVLLRLLMPRHSPYALVRLNFVLCVEFRNSFIGCSFATLM